MWRNRTNRTERADERGSVVYVLSVLFLLHPSSATMSHVTRGTAAMIGISKMASQVQPSATLAAGAKARQLRAEGINVFDYSLGEPDFNTPEHIRAAAVAAMNKGQTHYTPADGTPEARSAVCRYYQRNYGLEFPPTSVLLSNGAKHSIHNALAS